MTRYSDNILSGYTAVTSALSSRSAVLLTKSYNFSAVTGSQTQKGTFPPGTQNLTATLFITQQGSANTTSKVTISAGGTDLVTITSFGSATGIAEFTTTGVATITYVASACQNVPVPATNQTNGGEVPFAITYAKDAGDPSSTFTVVLNFNRTDTGFPAPGADAGVTGF